MPTVFCLRELLASKGMTQRELVERSGLSAPTIGRLCRNDTAQVSLATLDAIADALGVAPGDLIAKDPAKRRKR